MRDKELDCFIRDNVTVDCYGEYEQKTGWYHYLLDELSFPFIAYLPVEQIEKRDNSTVNVKIIVVGLDEEAQIDNYRDIMVRAEYKGYIIDLMRPMLTPYL